MATSEQEIFQRLSAIEQTLARIDERTETMVKRHGDHETRIRALERACDKRSGALAAVAIAGSEAAADALIAQIPQRRRCVVDMKKRVWVYWPWESKASRWNALFTSGGPNWENTLFGNFGPTMTAAPMASLECMTSYLANSSPTKEQESSPMANPSHPFNP